jgi:hypothetical protein
VDARRGLSPASAECHAPNLARRPPGRCRSRGASPSPSDHRRQSDPRRARVALCRCRRRTRSTNPSPSDRRRRKRLTPLVRRPVPLPSPLPSPLPCAATKTSLRPPESRERSPLVVAASRPRGGATTRSTNPSPSDLRRQSYSRRSCVALCRSPLPYPEHQSKPERPPPPERLTPLVRRPVPSPLPSPSPLPCAATKTRPRPPESRERSPLVVAASRPGVARPRRSPSAPRIGGGTATAPGRLAGIVGRSPLVAFCRRPSRAVARVRQRQRLPSRSRHTGRAAPPPRASGSSRGSIRRSGRPRGGGLRGNGENGDGNGPRAARGDRGSLVASRRAAAIGPWFGNGGSTSPPRGACPS